MPSTPFVATGAVRAATLPDGLRRRQQKYRMVTMCIETGMDAADFVEAVWPRGADCFRYPQLSPCR